MTSQASSLSYDVLSASEQKIGVHIKYVHTCALMHSVACALTAVAAAAAAAAVAAAAAAAAAFSYSEALF